VQTEPGTRIDVEQGHRQEGIKIDQILERVDEFSTKKKQESKIKSLKKLRTD
jgi:hypothetical protein